MTSGLAKSTRSWYCREILKVIKKYNRASVPTILAEMHRIPQSRYPVTEERIVSFLKYLRAIDIVAYHKSEHRKISSKWSMKKN